MAGVQWKEDRNHRWIIVVMIDGIIIVACSLSHNDEHTTSSSMLVLFLVLELLKKSFKRPRYSSLNFNKQTRYSRQAIAYFKITAFTYCLLFVTRNSFTLEFTLVDHMTYVLNSAHVQLGKEKEIRS